MNRLKLSLTSSVSGIMFSIATFITLIGCASIIKGELQTVTFKSSPSDAKLFVYNVREGSEIINATTPHTATLKRGAGYFKKAKYRVVIEKAAHKKEEILLEGAPNGWYIGGNIIFGGLIGWLILDPATGAMWTLDPEEINVNLSRLEASLPQSDNLTIVLKDSIPEFFDAVKDKLKAVKVK